jgi:hypothetical protein
MSSRTFATFSEIHLNTSKSTFMKIVHIGEDSNPVGEDSNPVGEGSNPVGEGFPNRVSEFLLGKNRWRFK